VGGSVFGWVIAEHDYGWHWQRRPIWPCCDPERQRGHAASQPKPSCDSRRPRVGVIGGKVLVRWLRELYNLARKQEAQTRRPSLSSVNDCVGAVNVVGKRSNQPRWSNRMAKGSRQLGRAPRWRSHEINCRSDSSGDLRDRVTLKTGILPNVEPRLRGTS
jgi:hypothetical protein